jgi:hypothetical protein
MFVNPEEVKAICSSDVNELLYSPLRNNDEEPSIVAKRRINLQKGLAHNKPMMKKKKKKPAKHNFNVIIPK